MDDEARTAACRLAMARRDLDRIATALAPLDAALALVPEERLAEQPVPPQYPVGLMIAHAYHVVATCAMAVRRGRLSDADAAELGTPEEQFTSHGGVAAFGARARAEVEGLLEEIDAEKVDADIAFHFGLTASGLDTVAIAHGELLHHRGQVQSFLRLMGIEPPDIYTPPGG